MIDSKIITFVTVAQLGSYTKAANSLYISQPAVSQQIKALEEELEVKLFIYQNRTLKLTPAGKKLLSFAESIQAQSKKFHALITNPAEKNQLSFASTLSIADSLMPKIITKIVSQQPQINITCHVLNTAQCLTELCNGKVDFALVEGNFDKQEFCSQEIFSDDFIAVGSKKLGLSATVKYQLRDLLKYPVIFREYGSGSYDIFHNLISAQNITATDFKSQYQIGSPTTIKKLLSNGLGISFLYRSVVEKMLQSEELIEIHLTDVHIKHPIYLVYLKNNYYEQDYLNLITSAL